GSVWMPGGTGDAWAHIRKTGLDGLWNGDDLGAASDVNLTSPPLNASATDPVVLTSKHAYSFEADATNAFDGGMIEFSTDGGMTWADVSTVVAPGYTGTLFATSGNPLGGRQAFTGKNAAFPNFDSVSLDFGTALNGKTFQIRFRIGTDAAASAPGWQIDD